MSHNSCEPRFSPPRLLDFMRDAGVSFHLYEHEAVFTVASADKVSGSIAGAHTRNLFLKDKKDRMFLVTLRHDTPIDLKKLADLLGSGRFSFGSAERLWRYLGVTPGSVTPLAILNDLNSEVTLVLEQEMMAQDLVNFHPLINTMTIGLTPDALMTILEKCAITPHIIDLTDAAPDEAKNAKDIRSC